MVKGISRQVIVVHSPDPKLFEQAIFILKDNAVGEGITDEALLKEAQKAIHTGDRTKKRRHLYLYGAVWAAGGALHVVLLALSGAVVGYLADYSAALRLRNCPICDTIPHIAAGGGAPPEGDFPCG